MCAQPNIASTAFLIADPARASMLMALVDGRALPAGELAYAACDFDVLLLVASPLRG